jgi:hypothetical protein
VVIVALCAELGNIAIVKDVHHTSVMYKSRLVRGCGFISSLA